MKRMGLVAWRELVLNLRRPMFWFLLAILVLMSYGLSSGNARIQTGDSSVGGTKPFVTSEFAIASWLPVLVFLVYAFFISVAAGMTVIHDDDLRVGELLHATRLRPWEYIWGKFAAVVVSFLLVLAIHVLAQIVCNHVIMSAERARDLQGPFSLMNYLRPAIVFAVPAILFLAGVSFALGELGRQPSLVYVLPVASILTCVFFLWGWSPNWLPPQINRWLMWIDPSGFRWLIETWLKGDRGVAFYNHETIPLDRPFVISRLAFAGIGLLAVAWSHYHFAATLRGTHRSLLSRLPFFGRRSRVDNASPTGLETIRPSLGELGMTTKAPGLFRGILAVARVELRELRSQPGLYLFVPLILLEAVSMNLVAVGAFDTPLLQTPGTLAVGSMNTLSLLIGLLLLFYTVESLQRERTTRLGSISYATPVGTAALLFGKTLANSFVGTVILLAHLAACEIVLLFQWRVGFDFQPFAIVWGLLLIPTFLLWTSFVTAVQALTTNRYATYGIGLSVLAYTGYKQTKNEMNWVGNWDLWSAVRWSDLGLFEMDRRALVLNRVMALGLTVLFTALAVRWFRRRDLDPVAVWDRLRPWNLTKTVLKLLPYGVVPVVAGVALYTEVNRGFQGEVAKKVQKEYWKQNLATWKDAPMPALTAVDMEMELDPVQRWFRVSGTYDLLNHYAEPLARFVVTGGDHWHGVTWTLDGQPFKPDFKTHLYVFAPERPLSPQQHVKLGFSYEGRFPRGVSKNGGGNMEFILPSGVVLTSFGPSFAPQLGYLEDVGVEDENRYESKTYPPKWYEGVTPPLFGSPTAFTTRLKITAPSEYTVNSVGTLMHEEEADGKRTVEWRSDFPVRMFNVVAGKWKVRRGEGTAIYYHPSHAYNIEEMAEALGAARKYYSEWFAAYPWRELKLSEFANLATYAQGFATDITFAEGIGFLTESTPKARAAFVIAAHEAAHQWWGNTLVPGKGPGGNILSEGLAHFSTMLLCEQVKGPHARITFAKQIEETYSHSRRKDAERPLVRTDGTRPGETTVMYDKGGWVFWMMTQQMGREPMLKGLRAFIEKYRYNADHPVLEDFIASMRPFAADAVAFDEFVKQWFESVVVPEYELSEAKFEPSGDGGSVTVTVKNIGTGKMPLIVAAIAGERFDETGTAKTDYEEARGKVLLGEGESQTITIECPFKPDRVIVDPDAMVLQLRRKAATASLGP